MKNTEPTTTAQLEQWASSGRDLLAEYKKEMALLKPEDRKTKCCDCGRFVDKECWAPKTSKAEPMCHSCASDYDWYF